MVRAISFILSALLVLCTGAGCASKFSPDGPIGVYIPQTGTGTLYSFASVFGLLEYNEEGEISLWHNPEARSCASAESVVNSVAEDMYGIGFVSMAQTDASVKVLKLNGVEPTGGNVTSDIYECYRSFSAVTSENGAENALSRDFYNYLFSDGGQKIVAKNGYASIIKSREFSSAAPAGECTVYCSQSSLPLMQRLVKAYNSLVNPDGIINLSSALSSECVDAVSVGKCAFSVISRDLHRADGDGLSAEIFAVDGIAVIVNPTNPADNITSEQIRSIFTGEAKNWTTED